MIVKLWSVAKSEYLNAVQSKAFLVGIVLMPVFAGGAILVQQLTKDRIDTSDRRFAVVDRSGRLHELIASAAESRNANEIHDDSDARKQIQPRFLPEIVTAPDVAPMGDKTGGETSSPAASERIDLLLSDRVRAGELFAFVIIGRDVLLAGDGGDREISYYTQTPTFRDLPRWLDEILNEEIQRSRFEEAGVDREMVEALSRRIPVRRLGLVEQEEGGEIQEAKRENDLQTFGVPVGAMFFLFMLVMMSAPALLNSVLEEKIQKISEVLVSSVTPFQLMMGKLIATIFVSLTLSVLYVGAAALLLYRFDLLGLVPVSLWFWFFLFQLLALLIFGSIFIGLGAACSEIRDAQSLMAPAMMLAMLPCFTWFVVLQSPTSGFSRAISLFPPATPTLMLLRVALPPGPPWWEIALSVVLTVIFAIFCVAAAAKIFRIGILSQGEAPSLAKLAKWVFSK